MAPPQPGVAKYPAGVGSKFSTSGEVLRFPGNTIVSHLSPSSDLYASLLQLYEKLQNSHLSSLYTMLPPSSWHMTVFEGVCDQVRSPGYWTDDLLIDATLDECTAHFTRKLKDFDLKVQLPFKMRIEGITALDVGIGLHLEPRNAEEEAKLRTLRDRLAELLKIRRAQHDVYELHLSLAYFIKFPSDAEKEALTKLILDHLDTGPKEFELGAPEFCTFENMFHFERQFYLGDGEV